MKKDVSRSEKVVHRKIELYYKSKYKDENKNLINKCIELDKANLGLAEENRILKTKLQRKTNKKPGFRAGQII